MTTELDPRDHQALEMEFMAYAEAKREEKAYAETAKMILGNISAIRRRNGLDTVELNGFKATEVISSSTSLDEKKLLQFMTVDDIDACRVTTPRKPYERVSIPKDRE